MKLCIDCIHYVEDETCDRTRKATINPVNGKETVTYRSCEEERVIDYVGKKGMEYYCGRWRETTYFLNKCGPEAAYWETRHD